MDGGGWSKDGQEKRPSDKGASGKTAWQKGMTMKEDERKKRANAELQLKERIMRLSEPQRKELLEAIRTGAFRRKEASA